jgi:hypothetical protein
MDETLKCYYAETNVTEMQFCTNYNISKRWTK